MNDVQAAVSVTTEDLTILGRWSEKASKKIQQRVSAKENDMGYTIWGKIKHPPEGYRVPLSPAKRSPENLWACSAEPRRALSGRCCENCCVPVIVLEDLFMRKKHCPVGFLHSNRFQRVCKSMQWHSLPDSKGLWEPGPEAQDAPPSLPPFRSWKWEGKEGCDCKEQSRSSFPQSSALPLDSGHQPIWTFGIYHMTCWFPVTYGRLSTVSIIPVGHPSTQTLSYPEHSNMLSGSHLLCDLNRQDECLLSSNLHTDVSIFIKDQMS